MTAHTARRRAQRGGATYVVLFMAVLYAVSSVDRYITVLLLADIGAEFSASDTDLALLVGAAFALVYAVGGVPIAYLLDHHNRIRIVSLGVLLWSMCTVLSGFATSYGWLVVLRGGVALGEAVVTPATVSLIADLFDGRARVKALAAYGLVASSMVTGALVVGGFAVAFATELSVWFDDLVVWRTTFAVVGLPSIFLSFIALWTIREPARKSLSAVTGRPDRLFARDGFMHANIGFFAPYYLGLGAFNSMIVATLTWAPSLAQRNFGISSGDAGIWIGAAGLPGILLGTYVWSRFGQAANVQSQGRPYARALVLASAILGAGVFGISMSPEFGTLLCFAFVVALGIAASTTLPSMLVQFVSPPSLRAQLIAMNILFGTLLGMTLGPVGVTVIAEQLFGGDLRYGLASWSIFGSLCAMAAFASAGRRMSKIAIADAADTPVLSR